MTSTVSYITKYSVIYSIRRNQTSININKLLFECHIFVAARMLFKKVHDNKIHF